MGMLTIKTEGSFGNSSQPFAALKHGHAHAIAEAMKYLSSMLTHAINLDHELHDDGEKPDLGFTKGATDVNP